MKILYLHPLHQCGPIKSVLTQAGHHVSCVTDPDDVLDLLRTGHFSAVLMAEEVRNSEAFALISELHRICPELFVFPLTAWRSGLPETLQSIECASHEATNIPDA